jgi:L-aminopeptidase/D-esterase-like protein
VSEEVDVPLMAQRCRIDDRAFTGLGRVLNTGGLSADGLLCIAAMAQAGPSEPVVKEAEERALAGTVAVDVEERADALIKQLEDANHHGVRTFSILPLVSSFFCAFV